ncbi:MAG: glycosyltransferase family 4 protein [Planctomycetota bacterium]|jgi:glycosyltransferase involved in cell wall biosynthesis
MATESARQVKIAHIVTRMDWGGAPDIVRILCESLESSYEVRLIIGPSKHLSERTRLFLDKFKDNVITVSHLRRDINPLWDLLALIKLFLLFRAERFDIVHTHTAKAGLLGRIAGWLAGVPTIIYMPHGHVFYGYFGLLMSRAAITVERVVAYITDKVMVLTELEKRDLVAFKVTTPDKIIVVNSGLELEAYKESVTDVQGKKNELQIGEGISVVGVIGRLEPVKGHRYLVEAARMVTKEAPRVKFLIVGDGSLRSDLESRCQELGVEDKFIFTGWKEDVCSILPTLDILVLPSVNEAVGRVLIEAGACGIPVVATNVGGVPEIVRDNETGVLVAPGSPEEMARAIIDLLNSEGKRQRMSFAAEQWIGDRFSAHRMVEDVSSSYEVLTART